MPTREWVQEPVPTKNAKQFALDLMKKEYPRIEREFRNFRDGLLYRGLQVIDDEWPVETGFSRASNLPFIDDPESVTVLPPKKGGDADFKGEFDKTDKMRTLLRATDPFDTVGIASNVIYAPPLEDGHSPQGSHMYRRSYYALRRIRKKAKR